MSVFTIQLKDICGVSAPEHTDFDCIGLGGYEIWDENYRHFLNTKIVSHFWFREIGFETIEQFVFMVNRTMNEIMGYYNQLALTTTISFDPLKTIDVQTMLEQSSKTTGKTHGVTTNQDKQHVDTTADTVEDSETTSTATNDGKSRSVSSDTPQTRLNNYEDYATAATDSVSESGTDTTATSTGSSTTEQLSETVSTGEYHADQLTDTTVEDRNREHRTGYEGVPAELLTKYRETIISVDSMIIRELEKLFMGVWDNGEQYNGFMGYY